MASFKNQYLAQILGTHLHPAHEQWPTLSWKMLQQADLAEGVLEVYKELGGILPKPSVQVQFDGLFFREGLVLLDDELHFNRFRRISLMAEAYDRLPEFPLDAYRNYCRKNEQGAVKAGLAGKAWSDRFSEKQFGKPLNHNMLDGRAAPAWRQRAFNDLLTDLSPLVFPELKLLRLSVYDRLMLQRELIPLSEILAVPHERHSAALLQMVCRKLGTPPPEKRDEP